MNMSRGRLGPDISCRVSRMTERYFDHSTCSAGLAHGLPDYCAGRGIDLARFAAAVGINFAQLGDYRERLSTQRYASLLTMLARESGDEAFGLHFGEAFRLGDSGPLGFAMMNAPNLEAMYRFYEAVSDLSIEQMIHSYSVEGRYFVSVNACSPLLRDMDIFVDLFSIVFLRHSRVHAGRDWIPDRVELQRDEPRDRRPWERAFGNSIRFGRPVARNYILIADIRRSNPDADNRLFEYLSESLMEMRDAYAVTHDLVTRVRRIIAFNLQVGRAGLKAVASDMAMSERSLQRRLAESGVDFGALVQEVRQGVARALLSRPGLRMEEIAERCGYGSVAAFSRAISRSEGVGPAALRKTLLPMKIGAV